MSISRLVGGERRGVDGRRRRTGRWGKSFSPLNPFVPPFFPLFRFSLSIWIVLHYIAFLSVMVLEKRSFKWDSQRKDFLTTRDFSPGARLTLSTQTTVFLRLVHVYIYMRNDGYIGVPRIRNGSFMYGSEKKRVGK